MKTKFPVFSIRSLLVLVIALLTASRGNSQLMQGESLLFEAQDFVSAPTARKPWIILRPEEGPTSVWSVKNASLAPNNADGRLKIADNRHPNSEIVWKIDVPENRGIKEFRWGVNTVLLTGTDNDQAAFRWEYSVDGEEWKELFSCPNRKSGDPLPLVIQNKEYAGTFSPPYPGSFFVRARNSEENPSGATSYYCIFSAYPNGGENIKSFVSVVTEPK